ncbi:BglG family transcription antiterminator [Bacillus rugosus]|uniref:BglG family transcription antiterminator n=1 Tax=Bacillus rugosus TaxID=2715209 RepID=UPI002DB96DAB|nr:BglG family transcription antiterminator [Bacillus rugosus]MEC1548494.1 BglG family transcription antiterminator [Bacillus rugosus]
MEQQIVMNTRQKQLIYRLLHAHAPVPLKEIAEDLHISVRTVQREMSQIKSILKHYQLHISKKFGTGVVLKGDNTLKERLASELDRFFEMKDYTPEERKQGLICDLLKLKEPAKLFVFSRQYHVSESTISHDLDKLKAWFASFQIQLHRKPGIGVYIQGEDMNIRQATAAVMLEQMLPEAWIELFHQMDNSGAESKTLLPGRYEQLIDVELLHRVHRVIAGVLSQEGARIDERNMLHLSIHLTLAIRCLSGGHVREIPNNRTLPAGYHLTCQVIKQIEAVFDIHLSPDDIDHVKHHLAGLEKEQQTVHIDDAFVAYLTQLFILKTEEALQEPLMNSALLEGLKNHLRSALTRITGGLAIHNPLLQQIQEKYKPVYNACEQGAEVISAEIGTPVPDAEIAFLTLHIGASYYDRQMKQSECRAIVVCASGFGTSRFISAKLKKEIRNLVIVDIVASYQLAEWLNNHDTIDFIISTIHLDQMKEKTVVVSPLLTEKEIDLLQTRIANCRNNKSNVSFRINKYREREYLQTAAFGEGMLQVLRHFSVRSIIIPPKKRFEIMRHIDVDGLPVANRAVLIEDLQKREEKGGFIVRKLAVLHTRSAGVTSLFVRLIRPDHPLPWNGKEAEAILVMAGPADAPLEHFAALGEISQSFIDEHHIEMFLKGSEEEVNQQIKRILVKAYETRLQNIGEK